MLDIAYHVFNYVIAGCYFTIFFLIFRGLWQEKALGRNVLGSATCGIFLTCCLGHLLHATTSHVWSSEWAAGLQVVVDGWTILPAVTYLILRRKYGLIIRGPDMINEYRLQLAQKSDELQVMQQFEKLKDEFLAMASHELRTPLTTIKGYAQILTKNAVILSDKKATRAVQAINHQVDVMTRLIQALLDVSRIHSGKLEINLQPLNLASFMSELVSQLQITSGDHQINLNVCSTESVCVQADSERLEQVISNLVNNAIKYSPQSQQIDLAVEVTSSYACIHVTDYGSGIAEEELPLLFDRFYRSPQVRNSNREGLGLGLYICKQIMEASGGEISVKSVPGRGSTFTLNLPCVRSNVLSASSVS